MKELSIEQKANAYDEAVENMRKFRNALNNHEETDLWVSKKDIVTDIEYYFPELKESEDEKIRKLLIRLFTSNANEKFDDVSTEEIIAWLEKQGEPNPYNGVSFKYNGHTWGMCARDGGVEILIDSELKAFVSIDKSFIYPIHPQPILVPKSALESAKEEKVDNQNCVNNTDKVEPKFHKGDLVVDNRDYVWKIEEILNQSYMLKGIEGGGSLPTIEWVDKNFHLWTIKDVKDGDVLVYRNIATEIIMLFKSWVVDREAAYTHFHIFDNDYRVNSSCDCSNGVHLATKEQRVLLFQKMKEAGYEWDAEKKEPKKIEQSKLTEFEDVVKDMMDTYRDAIGDYETTTEEVKEQAAYMLSLIPLKPTVGWKPSEEQMDALESAVSSLQSTALESLYRNLKKL